MKQKRYCLVCHGFKPERCHHCAVCNRCILNMDHHCRIRHVAWINNCVGFYNRKFFILLLMYADFNAYFVMFMFLGQVKESLNIMLSDTIQAPNFPHLLYIFVYLLLVMLCLILTKFTYFHIQLVLRNSTTIENLDKNSQDYSISPLWNWRQVFGRNAWLWFLPISSGSSGPVGNGITWKVSQKRDIKRDLEENKRSPPLSPALNSSNPISLSHIHSLNSSVDYSGDQSSVVFLKPELGTSPFVLPENKS